jgi:hypothetical protein
MFEPKSYCVIKVSALAPDDETQPLLFEIRASREGNLTKILNPVLGFVWKCLHLVGFELSNHVNSMGYWPATIGQNPLL